MQVAEGSPGGFAVATTKLIADQGLTLRSIAPVTEVDEQTVRRDLAGAPFGAPNPRLSTTDSIIAGDLAGLKRQESQTHHPP